MFVALKNLLLVLILVYIDTGMDFPIKQIDEVCCLLIIIHGSIINFIYSFKGRKKIVSVRRVPTRPGLSYIKWELSLRYAIYIQF